MACRCLACAGCATWLGADTASVRGKQDNRWGWFASSVWVGLTRRAAQTGVALDIKGASRSLNGIVSMAQQNYSYSTSHSLDECHAFFRKAFAQLECSIEKDKGKQLKAKGVFLGISTVFDVKIEKRSNELTLAAIVVDRKTLLELDSNAKLDKCFKILKEAYENAGKMQFPVLMQVASLSPNKRTPYAKLINECTKELDRIKKELDKTSFMNTRKFRSLSSDVAKLTSRLQAACDNLDKQRDQDESEAATHDGLELLLSSANGVREKMLRKNVIEKMTITAQEFQTQSEILNTLIWAIRTLLNWASGSSQKLIGPPS